MNTKKIHAVSVDLETISTFCNNLRCKEYYHSYESKFNLDNRKIIVKSRCPYEVEDHIEIIIDDSSLRCCLTYHPNRSFTFSKRKFNKQQIENGFIPLHKQLIKKKGTVEVKF
jgi:hypothetical protein